MKTIKINQGKDSIKGTVTLYTNELTDEEKTLTEDELVEKFCEENRNVHRHPVWALEEHPTYWKIDNDGYFIVRTYQYDCE